MLTLLHDKKVLEKVFWIYYRNFGTMNRRRTITKEGKQIDQQKCVSSLTECRSPEIFTPWRKLSYTVPTSGYCRVTISIVSVVLLAPSVPWEKGWCPLNSSLQTKFMESKEGGIGTVGVDLLVIACHAVSHILIQAENRQRLLASGERYSGVFLRSVCKT